MRVLRLYIPQQLGLVTTVSHVRLFDFIWRHYLMTVVHRLGSSLLFSKRQASRTVGFLALLYCCRSSWRFFGPPTCRLKAIVLMSYILLLQLLLDIDPVLVKLFSNIMGGRGGGEVNIVILCEGTSLL